MALVTLQQAKDHLKVSTNESDSDIALKMEQASALILDYLKNRTIAIASISVANPAVITTSVPHSLTSGTTYQISGTTTTPTVNGNQVVTVLSATTFSVPVSVTVGQSSAAGIVGAAIWTDANVPGVVQAAVLLMLDHLSSNRGGEMKADADLWLAIERLLMRSRDPALA